MEMFMKPANPKKSIEIANNTLPSHQDETLNPGKLALEQTRKSSELFEGPDSRSHFLRFRKSR